MTYAIYPASLLRATEVSRLLVYTGELPSTTSDLYSERVTAWHCLDSGCAECHTSMCDGSAAAGGATTEESGGGGGGAPSLFAVQYQECMTWKEQH